MLLDLMAALTTASLAKGELERESCSEMEGSDERGSRRGSLLLSHAPGGPGGFLPWIDGLIQSRGRPSLAVGNDGMFRRCGLSVREGTAHMQEANLR